MTTVGVRELRQDASGVLRRVEQGQKLVVTVHGRPVADLVPHTDARPAWRPVAELVALFTGVHDPDWERDLALIDGGVTDPFDREPVQ